MPRLYPCLLVLAVFIPSGAAGWKHHIQEPDSAVVLPRGSVVVRPVSGTAPTPRNPTEPTRLIPALLQSLLADRKLPARIDFGNGGRTERAARYRAGNRDPGFGWFDGLVFDGTRSSTSDTWLGDFVTGEDATFVIAVEPPDSLYRVTLTLGDPEQERGPVSIWLNGLLVADDLVTAAGAHRTMSAEAPALNGRLSIRFLSSSCDGFAVNGVEVHGPAGSSLGRLFPDPPPITPVPAATTLRILSPGEDRALLREFCDFLLANRPRQGGFSYHGAWYQNAYPVRTLMAGSRILGDPRYAEAALSCLDWFVSRQRPDGNWLAAYTASSRCDTIVPPDSSSTNLADVGTMTACLAMMAPLAGASAGRYVAAAERYAERISLPNQLLDGSFANRLWSGTDTLHPYSIATATQTLFLQSLYDATCKEVYREAAERGARWLARHTFLPTGRVALYPHDRNIVTSHDAACFGDVFYVADALVCVRTRTEDDSLRTAIDKALDNWLFGEKGLQAISDQGYWWHPSNPWSDSKMGGVLYVLARHPRRFADPAVSLWLDHCLAWIADPVRRSLIGVTAPPSSVLGAFALPATGFAGIGLAECVRLDSLNPAFRSNQETATPSVPEAMATPGAARPD